MKVEGIWSVESYGMYGWERVSTAVLENGRYFAASANHYTIGSYKKKKDKFTAKTRVTQYGEVRVIFGAKLETYDALFKGKIKNNGEIVGKILPVTGEKLDVAVRWKRLEKLD